MTPQIEIKHNIGNTLTIPNELDIKVGTYLSNNVAVAATSVPVDNANDFTAGNILLLLGTMGAENAEIINSSSHTNTAFTTAALIQAHARGEIAQQLNYDQIVVQKSATIDGVYSVFATQTFQVTQQNTVIFDPAGATTDYYKIQWRNSLTGSVSSLSDPISVDSYPENSVASIINPVIISMGVSKNDPRINSEFLISSMDDARKYVKDKLFGIRQAWNQEFEHPIKLLAGSNFVNLPDDIDFKETDRSLLAARFLISNILAPYNLIYIDKRNWNQASFSVTGSKLANAISIGATSIVLENTGDFPAEGGGVAYIATTDYDQTTMQIEFTDNDLTTNTLSGVTGVTRAVPAGTQIWNNPTIAQPIYYTVFEDKIVFDRVITDAMQGNNVYIDYYKKLDPITSMYQELPENYRGIYKWYLRWAIKYRKNPNLESDDPDLVKFEDLVTALFNNLYTGQESTIITS